MVNVLFLQNKIPDRRAPHAGVSATRSGDTVTRQELDHRRTIAGIQRQLKQRGYYAKPHDGALNLATRAAIYAYERDKRLRPTATPSTALLKMLIFGERPKSAAVGPSRAARDLIMQAQRALIQLGYQKGRPTGTVDQVTRKAITAFQRARGLRPSGRISAALIDHLGPALKHISGVTTPAERG